MNEIYRYYNFSPALPTHRFMVRHLCKMVTAPSEVNGGELSISQCSQEGCVHTNSRVKSNPVQSDSRVTGGCTPTKSSPIQSAQVPVGY